MAKTNIKSLREKADSDLEAEVGKLRDQLFRLRWQASGGSLEKPSKIREVRRSIARHLTVIGERRRAAGASSAGGKP